MSFPLEWKGPWSCIIWLEQKKNVFCPEVKEEKTFKNTPWENDRTHPEHLLHFFLFPLLNYFTFICNYSYHAHSLSLSLSVHFCQFWFYFVAKNPILTKNIHLEFFPLVPASLKYTLIHPFPFMLYLSREWREINCKEKEGGGAW